MFVTTRDETVRRRNKVYNNNKSVRSSKVSLLSALSVSTTESGGSNSTITQESYDRSHKSRRRRPREHRERREHREYREHRSRRPHYEDKNKSVDVFDFLVDESSKSREALLMTEDAKADQSHGAKAVDDRGEETIVKYMEETIRADIGESIEEEAVDDVGENTMDEDEITEDTENAEENAEEDFDDIEEDTVKVTVEDAKAAVEDTSSSDDDEDSEDEAPLPTPKVTIHIEEHEPEGYYRHMSDSGISMDSRSSSVSGFPPKPYLPVLHEEPLTHPTPQARPSNELALVDPRWAWPTLSPQPYPEGFIPPPCPAPPPAVVYDVPPYPPYAYPRPPYTPYGTPPPTPEEEIRGPGITIREPSGRRLKPRCFRTFTKISTRLMLQMQDDLADLEEELSLLDREADAAEAMSDRDSSPARFDRHDRRIREDEIYREAHVKLDQYYHALEMAQKVEDISRPANTSDLTRYHQWLDSRIQQSDRIRHLVGSDLRKFCSSPPSPRSSSPRSSPLPSASASPLSTPASVSPLQAPSPPTTKVDDICLPRTFQPQYLAYSALINAVVPLTSFKIISGALNRLIFLAIAIVIGSIVQDKMRTQIGKDELTCTLLCISISAFAAIFL